MNKDSGNTIKATELRTKLDKIFDLVNGGQEIIVTHRFKQPLRLEPVFIKPYNGKKSALSGLSSFDKAVKRPSPYSANVPIKKLYQESIAKKYAQ